MDTCRDDPVRAGIAVTEHRLADLHARAATMLAEIAGEDRALLRETLSHLADALEELEVAGEELAAQSAALYESQRRYRELFGLAPDGIIETDRGGRIIEVNETAAVQLGAPAARLVGKPLLVFVDRPDRRSFSRSLAEMAGSPAALRLDVRIQPRERPSFPASVVAALIGDERDPRILWDVRDVTDERELEAALEHLARHDPLTGCTNRAEFFRRLDGLLGLSRPPADPAAVLFVDLDGFKGVNDRLGHDAGDQLLVLLGARLRRAERATDLSGRLGGDEFALALGGVADETEAMALAERIRDAIAAPFPIDGRPVTVFATVGVAIGRPPLTAAELVRQADQAMYVGKSRGGDRTELFTETLRQRSSRRADLESDLRAAVDGGLLRTVYQPQVEVTTGRLVGVEALVRWEHPRLGVLAAEEFIAVAEASGLIGDIDRWVLGQACADGARWNADGASPLLVSINASPAELFGRRIVGTVFDALAASGLEASRLCVEMTERSAVESTAANLSVLGDLRLAGVELAVDDFGTGYSSLGYLRDLPVTILKIDKSFVSRVGRGQRDRLLVSAVLEMASALSLVTIAEGVESVEQLDALRQLGCDRAQGYLVGRPVEAAGIDALVGTLHFRAPAG